MSQAVTLHISFPQDMAELLGTSHQAVEKARELVILGLYQENRISGGKAAEWLGLTRRGFISLLARRGLDYFRLDPDEWNAQVTTVETWDTDHA